MNISIRFLSKQNQEKSKHIYIIYLLLYYIFYILYYILADGVIGNCAFIEIVSNIISKFVIYSNLLLIYIYSRIKF